MRQISILIAIVLVVTTNAKSQELDQWNFPISALVTDFLVDNDDNKWITTSRGVFRFDKTESWTTYNTSDGLPDDSVTSIALRDGRVTIATRGNGLAEFDGDKWSAIDLKIDLGEEFITALTDNLAGIYYYGTSDGRIYSSGNSTAKPVRKGYPFQLGTLTGISRTNSGLLIGRSMDGVSIERLSDGQAIQIGDSGSALPDARILCGQVINDTAYDGTAKGLYIVDFSSGFPQILGNNNSTLATNRIQALHVNKHQAWYGMDSGLVRVEGWLWDVYTSDNTNLQDDNVLELSVDRSNVLWIVTADKKLGRFDAPSASVDQLWGNNLFKYKLESNNEVLHVLGLEPGRYEVSVVSLTGQQRWRFTGKSGGSITLGLDGISSGVYVLDVAQLETGKRQTVKFRYTKG
ncbi:MAG: hypothetical protein JJ975_10190 [Bacteroidia bacterium]|nr:hypothetical protein [Bacteroidia bacterium]